MKDQLGAALYEEGAAGDAGEARRVSTRRRPWGRKRDVAALHITVVTLGVADLERSRRFYSEGLGWRSVLDLDEVVFYQAGFGLAFAIWPLEDLSADAGAELVPGSGFSLGCNVTSPREVDEVIERARSAGAAILKEPQPAPLFAGYQGYFSDPDGYLWDVVYNPGFAVASDGTVSFGAPEPS